MHAQCSCFANLNLLLVCRSRCRRRRRCLTSLMTLVILPLDVIYSVILPTLKRLSWKRLYCIVCHVNWKSQKDCTRFQIKPSGQPMRRVGGSGGRFGSCKVESILHRIKLYQATLTVYPPPPPPHYTPLSHWKMNITFRCPHLCCSSFLWGLCFIVDFVFSLFPNQPESSCNAPLTLLFHPPIISSSWKAISPPAQSYKSARVYQPSSCWVDTPYPPPFVANDNIYIFCFDISSSSPTHPVHVKLRHHILFLCIHQ